MLIGAVPLGGKNHQQIQTAVAKQVKRYQKLLEAFSGSARLEAALMVHIQVPPPINRSNCWPLSSIPACHARSTGHVLLVAWC